MKQTYTTMTADEEVQSPNPAETLIVCPPKSRPPGFAYTKLNIMWSYSNFETPSRLGVHLPLLALQRT
jgi:hypothetical protein